MKYTSRRNSREPKNLGVYEKKPRFSGGREVLLLKKEHIALRNRFIEHHRLTSPSLEVIPTRLWNNVGLFMMFLTKSKRALDGPDLLLLPGQFGLWLKNRNHFKHRQVHHRVLDAKKFIHYVLRDQAGRLPVPVPSQAGHVDRRAQADEPFTIGKPDGPREDGHYKIVLRYHSFLPDSDLARAQFELLYKAITDYLRERYQTRRRWTTYTGVENDLKVFLAYCAENHLWMPASSITKDIFISFIGSLRARGLTDSTAARYAQNVRKFLIQIRGIDPLISTCSMPSKPRANPEPMDVSIAQKLKKSISDTKSYNDLRDLTFILVLGSGLRITEACSLERSSIREVEKTPCLHIGQKVSKNGIARNVPIPPQTLQYLEKLFKRNASITDLPYAFLINHGKVRRADTTVMRRAYKQRAAAIGITYRRWLRPHNQRSRFVVDCMSAGIGDSIIAKAIGHTDLRSLEHYRSWSDKAVMEELRTKHPDFLSKGH
jgi:integrase